jgi:hypothetical protein
MRIPFPDVSSDLAVKAHMYICLEKGRTNKEFLKCQTSKPIHKLKDRPPFKYVEESPDVTRNPFNNTTIIDCDKSFYVENVVISLDILAFRRRNICEELFSSIISEIQHSAFIKEQLDSSLLTSINYKIMATAN